VASGASSVTIGGTVSGSLNVIAGNTSDGIEIMGADVSVIGNGFSSNGTDVVVDGGVSVTINGCDLSKLTASGGTLTFLGSPPSAPCSKTGPRSPTAAP
jgi:hypothetical protein